MDDVLGSVNRLTHYRISAVDEVSPELQKSLLLQLHYSEPVSEVYQFEIGMSLATARRLGSRLLQTVAHIEAGKPPGPSSSDG